MDTAYAVLVIFKVTPQTLDSYLAMFKSEVEWEILTFSLNVLKVYSYIYSFLIKFMLKMGEIFEKRTSNMILVLIYKINVRSQYIKPLITISQTNQCRFCAFVFMCVCLCLFVYFFFIFQIKAWLGIHYFRVQWNTTYQTKQMSHHSTFIIISNKIKIHFRVNIQWKFVEGMSNKALILRGCFP